MADTLEIVPTPGVDPSQPLEGKVEESDGVTRVTAGDISAPPSTKDAKAEVPSKFKNQDGSVNTEALLKSYLELEKGKPADTPKVEPTPEPKVEAKVTDVTSKLTAEEMTALTNEYGTDGKLSDKSYQTLSEKGITKEVVDQYIAGQTARVAQYRQDVLKDIGGEDGFSKLSEWAKVNLTESEIKTVNKAIQSGDQDQAKLVLSGLNARRTAAMGSEPRLVDGEAVTVTSGVQPYRSNEEVVRAMSDKRYKTDPAYREDVSKRLAVSSAFGR